MSYSTNHSTGTNPKANLPQVVANISAWPLFPDTYAVGSRSLDRYISVPVSKVPLVLEIVSLFDGCRSVESIAQHYLLHGRAIDIVGLQARLQDAGLLVGSKAKTELRQLAITFFDVPLDRLFGVRRRLICSTLVPLAYLSTLTIVLGALVLAAHHKEFVELGTQRVALPPAVFYSIAVVGFLSSVLWHESAHALTALYYGIVPARLSLLGYFMLIPFFVIRIPGLYLLPPRHRIRVWAAGIWASLTLGLVAAIFALLVPVPLTWRPLMARMALGNFVAVLVNLFPFLPTDGYFIFSTLLRQTNVRRRAWRALIQSASLRRAPSRPLVVYGLISAITVIGLLVRNMTHLFYAVRHSTIGLGLVFVLFLYLAVRFGESRKINLSKRGFRANG
jgi:Zn-dependent protease